MTKTSVTGTNQTPELDVVRDRSHSTSANGWPAAVGAGGERVAAGVVERSPREWRQEVVEVGEGGDEQPDATPT